MYPTGIPIQKSVRNILGIASFENIAQAFMGKTKTVTEPLGGFIRFTVILQVLKFPGTMGDFS